MLFDSSDDLLNRLDEETRSKLIELFTTRADYLQASSTVQRMRAERLRGSVFANQTEIDLFVEQTLVPLRNRVYLLQIEMLGDAVDVDKIKSMLPIIIAGMMSKVDLELVLNIIGVDFDAAMEVVELIREFINQ